MTITITPAGPHNLVGPGIPVRLQSSVTIPTGVSLQWSLNWFTVGGPTPAFHVDTFQFQSASQVVVPWTSQISPTISVHEGSPVTDDNVSLTSTLNRLDTGAAIDAGSATVVIDMQTGLANQQAMMPIPAGGLTAAQATQLQETHDQTQVHITTPTGINAFGLGQLFSMPTLDSLTLHEITSGPTSGFASAALPQGAIGLIVRITGLGAGYAATSPDDGWFKPELAVVNFFRGSDLVARVGIHTVSRFIYPLPGSWAEWVSTILGGTLPPDYSVQVSFSAGNLGRVFFTELP